MVKKITNLYQDVKEKEDELKRRKTVRDGYKILAGVGIVAGLYGYRLGRRKGYLVGVGVGHTKAVNDMVHAWSKHTKTLLDLQSRGD